MQVICSLSGYAYQIQGFNSNKLSNQEKPFSHIHPIMLANTKQLASIMPANKQEQALYVLATCYAFNDLISYASISQQGFKELCAYQGLTQLSNTILDSLTLFDSATIQLPTFSLNDESVTNILDYLDTCKCELALATNKAEQRKLAALAAKEEHKHKVLARATTMYPVKFANWILEQLPNAEIPINSVKQVAGAQPTDYLNNYWKRILTSLIKDPANYWSFDSRYVADLFNEIEDYITSDSVQGLEVYKLMDRVRAEASLFGASILGEPSSKYKASQPAKSISLGTVLTHNIDKPVSQCVQDAPASKPCKTQYSSHTQYLIALAKWRAVTGSALGSPSSQSSM
jgi:hypothetical protein